MIRLRGLAACALIVACSDPPAPVPRVTHVQQELDGMPVYHREVRRLLRADGTVVMETGAAIDPRTARTPAVFVDDEAGAIRRAAAGAQVSRARARKVWYPLDDRLVAAWVVEAYTADAHSTGGDLVRTIIAADGHLLAQDSLVADAFTYRVYAETTGELHPYDGPTIDATPHPTGLPDGSFPAYVPQQDITVEGLDTLGDPWLPVTATATAGNNVDAYADLNAPTGLGSGDFRATATGSAFAHTYDTAQGPLVSTEQQMASVTSLFYVLNWLHDFWYDAGFTEVAGNAQASNYGRGGLENDVLLAEGQDNALAGIRNNANMSTPDDGMSPRMQVYLWKGRDTREMTLAPSGRMPAFGAAVFGPQSFTVTGDLVLGTDGTGVNPTDGCETLTNTCTGKIVIVDRANCTFKLKTRNAQVAGAIGLIIANNVVADTPPPLGEDPNLVDPVIPTISVTMDEGAVIKTELVAGTVSATIHRDVKPELDGSLDGSLIAHEYGHYLHHRLARCSNPMCRALSEGWGDFSALMFLARPGDNLHGAFPLSIYATQAAGDDPGYFGIRRAPYSVEPAINALSFRHMANGEPLPTNHPLRASTNGNAESHNAGEIWASVLWDVYVALQEAGAAQGLSFDDVRAKMAHYMVTALSLVPTDASPLETRDAFLAAALASNPADHDVMIAAFARRGFGSCAVAPPTSSTDFVGIVESSIVAGNAQLAARTIDDGCDQDGVLDSGETTHLQLRVINQGHRALTDVTLAVTSQVPGITIVTPPEQLARLETFATTDLDVEVTFAPGITEPIAGDLTLVVTATGGCTSTVEIPLASRFNLDDLPESSATDTFDTAGSVWEPWTIAWHHERTTPLEALWHADDLAISSDTRLTSPPLVADSDQPVTLRFDHRFTFERNAEEDANYDGGVVEYSIDNGETWQDIATITAPGYTGTLTGDTQNALVDRDAYTGANAAWPLYDTVTLDLGAALAGQTFRIRFRVGTDDSTGAYGWDVDNVAFTGLVGTPFPAQVAENTSCEHVAPDDPIVSGGGGCCQGGRSSNGVLVFGVLLLLVRRRRTS